MLRQPKSLSLPLTLINLSRQHFLQNLHLQPYHHGTSRYRDFDDGSDKFHHTKGNGEGHLHLYKSRGQHLLTNTRVLDSIVRKSNIKPTDTVLEIGPGTGNLTLRLLEVAHKVVAIEIDKRMVEMLQKRVSECGLEDRLVVIFKDALKAEFPQFDLVVANIPYGISSPLIAKILFGTKPFRSGTLLLQKEFARRLLANPGDSEFNRLAVNVKLIAEVESVMDVSKRDFLPVPKVDSSVVLIRPKSEIPRVNLNEWWAFTRTCFSKKNKTLGATFKQKKKANELMRMSEATGLSTENVSVIHPFDCSDEDEQDDEMNDDGSTRTKSCQALQMRSFREKVIAVLRSSGYENKRPSKLSIEELLHLLSVFNQNGIYFHDRSENASNLELAASFTA